MKKLSAEKQASRRAVLAAGLSAAAATGIGIVPDVAEAAEGAPDGTSTLSFAEIPHKLSPVHEVSPGHDVQILLRWGDALTEAAPAWTPETQSAAAQKVQFGYDNDFIAFKPLPYGSNSSTRGLLCINHESTRNQLMFPGFDKRKLDDISKEYADVEIAASGHTIVEVALKNGQWGVNLKSRYNRRITADIRAKVASTYGPPGEQLATLRSKYAA